MPDQTIIRKVRADYEMRGQVKITRVDGSVEYQDIPEDGIEAYLDAEGLLSSTYPEGFAPAPVAVQVGRGRWRRLLDRVRWDKGAIVWTDKGQEKNVDVIDPATRAAQVTTYYGAWGSGSTAPVVANTALGTELAEARVATTITQPAVNQIQWLWEVTATGNRVVNEAGVFTATSAGDMWIRLTLSTLNIETGDRVEFTVILAFKDISE